MPASRRSAERRSALRAAGFTEVQAHVVPLLNVGFDPNTFSAMIAGSVAEFVAARAGVTAADAEAWLDDVTSLGDDAFFSLNRYVFFATKPVRPLPASPG